MVRSFVSYRQIFQLIFGGRLVSRNKCIILLKDHYSLMQLTEKSTNIAFKAKFPDMKRVTYERRN
jgi:hypothetical protein